MRKLSALLLAFSLLSGCISQLSEEQKFVKNYNLSEKAAGCFNGDRKISVVEGTFGKNIGILPHEYQDKLATAYNCDMVKIGAVAAYKDKPFFDDMMNTNSLKYFDTYVELNNAHPSLAEQMAKEGGPSPVYTRAREAGLGTIPAYVLSHKQLGSDESSIFKYIASFDSQVQIEAAKAYRVNLEIDELKFLSGDYGIVLQGGYSDTEDKYVEEVMKSFNADLAKYLTRGALLYGDQTITDKGMTELKWFEAEYPKMSPAMKSYFDSTLHPQIGSVDAVYFTDQIVWDNRAVSSAPIEAKYLIPPGYKIVVHTLNPGNYVKDGNRYISTEPQWYLTSPYIVTNPNTKDTWFFDDPLITTNGIDHGISKVDGKFFVTNKNISVNYISQYLVGDYSHYFENKIDVGLENLATIYRDGFTKPFFQDEVNHNDKNVPDMGIYINWNTYGFHLMTSEGMERFGPAEPFEYRVETYDQVDEQRYDKNGKPEYPITWYSDKMKPAIQALNSLAQKALPYFSILNRKYNPI